MALDVGTKKEKELPEESFYYSKERNFVLIACLSITLVTIVFTFLANYYTLFESYSTKIHTLVTTFKEQSASGDNIYFVPVIFVSFFVASIIMFILIRIIYYGKQLLNTKPQLQFTHEGLITANEGTLPWKDITGLEITSSATYSPEVHDYVIQKFLHIHFFSTASRKFPISDLARSKRIEELVYLYNDYYKKVGDKKPTNHSAPFIKILIMLIILTLILFGIVYTQQPIMFMLLSQAP